MLYAVKLEPQLRSPFPGMDPYLEERWGDVHGRLISYTADSLVPQLAEDLAARVEEQIYIDLDEGARSSKRPDVLVVEEPKSWTSVSIPATGIAAEPILLADPGLMTERSIQIIDSAENRVVTSIEILSPWNKLPGGGRDQYLQKRNAVLASRTSLVEIVLVREADWVSMLFPTFVAPKYRSTYRVTVNRNSRRPRPPTELYPIALRSRLPIIKVPLREGEADVLIDLQPLIDTVYRNGRHTSLNYQVNCDPPLTGTDAQWADELLRTAGRRGSST